MRIWILVKKDRLNTNHSRRFKEEGEKLGVKIRHVLAEDFEIVEPSYNNQVWHKGRFIKRPDILITRTSSTNYFTSSLIRHLKNIGTKVFNSAFAIELAEDKLRTIQILSQKQIPIPKSILAKSPVDYKYIKSELGLPLILKTVHGAKGEGVLKFDKTRHMREIVNLLQKSTDGKLNLIFQKYIEKSFGKDIRVMVIGGRAVAAVLRQGRKGQFKANVSRGGQAQKIPITAPMRLIAEAATKALKLDISGVDLLINDDHFLVAEINSTPSIYGFEKTTQANITKKILQYAIKSVE